MVATKDPTFHQERYGHTPEIIKDGCRLRWSDRQCWVIVLEENEEESHDGS